MWGSIFSAYPFFLLWLWEYVYLVNFIASEVWSMSHCLGLGHPTVGCAVLVCSSEVIRYRKGRRLRLWKMIIQRYLTKMCSICWYNCINMGKTTQERYRFTDFETKRRMDGFCGVSVPQVLWPEEEVHPNISIINTSFHEHHVWYLLKQMFREWTG